LQDAFTAETGAYIGNWSKIGYAVPGTKTAGTTGGVGTTGTTNNFKYTEESYSGTWADGTVALSETAASVWSAENILKLNDCAGSANWALAIVKQGNGGEFAWKTKTLSEGCAALTPNFANLGTGTYSN